MPLHHVIPKHEWKKRFGNLNGVNSSDNLVNLTTEQHAQVHLFLFEINGNEYDRIAYLAISNLIGKEEIQRLSSLAANIGNKHCLGIKRGIITAEHREKLSKALKGHRKPPGFGAKISKAMKGNTRTLGLKHSAESIEKMRKAPKHTGPQRIIDCPYCPVSGGANIMRRWHFERCKNAF